MLTEANSCSQRGLSLCYRPRRFLLAASMLVWAWFLASGTLAGGGGSPGDPASPLTPASAPGLGTEKTGLRLLFSDANDIADVWGDVRIGVTPVRLIRECEPPDFNVVCCLPVGDGSWAVFGQRLTETTKGPEPFERVASFKIVRSFTRDGATFERQETVLESQPGPWTDHCAIAFNPDAGEYLLLKLKVDTSGFAYTAFFSKDGTAWREHAGNPLFYEGDAMSLFWSPVLHRFICVSKSLQPWRKHLIDHGGTTPSLGDKSLRDRRVLMIRSSADGQKWEPSVSLPDVWNRHGKKAAIPSQFLTVPDAGDPPDLEFYSGNGIWYHDRAYMMVLNYAASPLSPRQHAPHLDNEWWTSPDGLHWERPARGVNALEVFPNIPRLEGHPLVAGGKILFPRGKMLLGLPEDRISFAIARSNSEFSTRVFEVPAGNGLVVNAAVPSVDRPFAKDQAYIMAALLDENGAVIPGFEAEKCVIRDVDAANIPLKWGDASVGSLAGRKCRVRFFVRSASIYAVGSLPALVNSGR